MKKQIAILSTEQGPESSQYIVETLSAILNSVNILEDVTSKEKIDESSLAAAVLSASAAIYAAAAKTPCKNLSVAVLCQQSDGGSNIFDFGGMRQLLSLDRVLVRQKTTVFEGNKYVLVTPGSEVFMYAKEDAGTFAVMFGGKNRAFHMDLFDTEHKNVIALRRPYTFGTDKLEVRVCGQLVSVVRQEATFFKPVLNINDAHDQPVFRVKGSVCHSSESDFCIYNRNKKQVGVIRKLWGGMWREAFTNNDNFLIEFPVDLDVRFKAAIIGTCFLIDFLYYEK